MKKTLTVFAIFAIVGLFAIDSFAQSFQGRRTGRARISRSSTQILRVLKANQEELKITADQLKAIEDLTYSFEERKIEARSEASKNQLELRKLLQDRENLDYAKLRDALSKTSEHKHDMMIEGFELRDEISKILTPEQNEALKSMRLEKFRDRKDRRDFRGRSTGRAGRGRMQRPPLNRQPIKRDF